MLQQDLRDMCFQPELNNGNDHGSKHTSFWSKLSLSPGRWIFGERGKHILAHCTSKSNQSSINKRRVVGGGKAKKKAKGNGSGRGSNTFVCISWKSSHFGEDMYVRDLSQIYQSVKHSGDVKFPKRESYH